MEISQRAVKELIRQFSGQAQMLSIPRPFIRLTGDHECALMLNQIIYWSERTEDPDGWFYKTHDDWAEELELTPAQIRRITKALEPLGVESKLKKHNGAPKMHYRVREEIFYRKLLAFLEEQKPRPIIKKVDNQESKQSKLSDPIINNPDNQQPPLSEYAQSEESDSEQPSLSSSKDTEITAKTTSEITHTHGAPAPPSSNGNGKQKCVCVTLHGSKLCDDERIRIASQIPGVRIPENYAMAPDARRGTYDAVFIKRKKELEKQHSTVPGEPERDISCCPDCKGSPSGMYYPDGYDKPARKCKHERLDETLERMEREVEEMKMEVMS